MKLLPLAIAALALLACSPTADRTTAAAFGLEGDDVDAGNKEGAGEGDEPIEIGIEPEPAPPKEEPPPEYAPDPGEWQDDPNYDPEHEDDLPPPEEGEGGKLTLGIPPGGGGGEETQAAPPNECDTPPAGGSEQLFGENLRGLIALARGITIPTDWARSCWLTSNHKKPIDTWFNTSSPNHKLLARAWNYAWVRKYQNNEDAVGPARKLLTNFFKDGRDWGHYTFGGVNEVLTVSHYQLWAEGVAAVRILAVVYHDDLLKADTGTWMRAEKAMWDKLVRNNKIRAPGTRFNDDAVNYELRDFNYRQYKGEVDPPSPNGNPNWWVDKYNASAWMLRDLRKNLGDDLGGSAGAGNADLLKLHNPLCLCTNGTNGSGELVFAFKRVDGASGIVYWVKRVGAATEVEVGPVGNTDIPRIANATLFPIGGPSSGCFATGTTRPICKL